MENFNVGDRVRVVEYGGIEDFVGLEGTVKYIIAGPFPISVALDGQGGTPVFNVDELEVVAFTSGLSA
jgi:hypothetical protein